MKIHKTYNKGTKHVSLIIEELANTTSKLEKEAILKREAEVNNEELMRVLYVACDPSIRFYTKQIPDFEESTLKIYDTTSAIDILVDSIASREFTWYAAQDMISFILARTESESIDLVKKVLLKDLDCGVGATTINKFFKGLITEPPYQQYSLFSEKFLKKIKLPVISQFKADGCYGNHIVTENTYDIISRQGIPFTYTLPDVLLDRATSFAIDWEPFVLHGECLVKKYTKEGLWEGEFLPRQEGNGLINSDTPPKPEDLFLEVWDIITLEDYNKRESKVPYNERLQRLQEFVIDSLSDCCRIVETRLCNTVDALIEHFKEIREKGLEGSMVKPIDMLWKDSKLTTAFKLKAIFECEYKVIGYTEHSKKKDWIGALICESSDGKVKFKCGSGLKDTDRKKPFSFYNGKIITVKANDLTTSETKDTLSLSHPRFVEIRNDKVVADNLEKIQESRDSMLELLKRIK